ncbi:MAG: cyclic nucleotide-binding domain-containing protein [Comamonadaceae bacterium]|nr:MAG: cyclic nucleotide-binding domain-containing protein [Comamonadaceae bacterium]
MNAPLVSASLRFDIQGLAQSVAHSHAKDRLPCSFNQASWDILATYMQPFALKAGQVLMQQGTLDRTLYFVEEGSLSVHYQDLKGRIRLALVGPGSLVGEGSFFSHLPRRATVQAGRDCKLWCLTPLRFQELSVRHGAVALELSNGMAGVMAQRLFNRLKRVAVT